MRENIEQDRKYILKLHCLTVTITVTVTILHGLTNKHRLSVYPQIAT